MDGVFDSKFATFDWGRCHAILGEFLPENVLLVRFVSECKVAKRNVKGKIHELAKRSTNSQLLMIQQLFLNQEKLLQTAIILSEKQDKKQEEHEHKKKKSIRK